MFNPFTVILILGIFFNWLYSLIIYIFIDVHVNVLKFHKKLVTVIKILDHIFSKMYLRIVFMYLC